MAQNFNGIKINAKAEYLCQGSKFIAYAQKIESVQDAQSFLLGLKKEHPFATHICYAYILYNNQGRVDREKCSDDGEPSGTAGKPILEVLKKKQMGNLIIAVVRYFGGTLLGANGLVRAYSTSTENALQFAGCEEKKYSNIIKVIFYYNEVSKVEKFLNTKGVKVLDAEFLEDVEMTLAVEEVLANEIVEEICNLVCRKFEYELIEKRFE